MSRVQQRITIDASLWKAVEAVAEAKGQTTSRYVEYALRTMLDPGALIEKAAERISNDRAEHVETRDRILGISDFIIDLYAATSPDQSGSEMEDNSDEERF